MNIKHFFDRFLKLFVVSFFSFLVFIPQVYSETTIPEGEQIQPPTRFIWTRYGLETRGFSEEQVASAVSYGWTFFLLTRML